MEFTHPEYGFKVDTESDKFKKLIKKLNLLYSEIPESKCLNCPNKLGVEADCCKTFSPPLLLTEFLNIMTIIEKLDKDKQDRLAFECFQSFLNPDYDKPCVLLKNGLCQVYKARQLSCRLFGMYEDKEYNDRLNKICSELTLLPEEIPFREQCKNLEINSKQKFVSSPKSDRIFKEIHNLDIELFQEKRLGEKIVKASLTYMPFDAHYLCLRIGPDNLDQLADLKLALRNAKILYEANKDNATNTLEYFKMRKNVKDFLETVKNSLMLKDEEQIEVIDK